MSTADLTDEALGRRALAGDREAFTELFARHERGLFTVAHRLTGSAEDAADITQEAFLRVFARLDALEGCDLNLAAYLHRTARNLVYDRSSRRARETPVEDVALMAGADTAAEADPELSALIGAQGADVRAANARLPERHRLALALREIEDMSYEDIGAVLDTTPGAVAALLVRARLALRRELRLEQVDAAAMDPGCRARLGDVGALIDGELDPDRAHVLSQHLELCPSCRAARHAFEQSRVLYRAWLPLPIIGLGAATAKAAESRGLVRFGDGGRRAGAARALRAGGGGAAGGALAGGRRAGALVAAGTLGALLLFGAPTLVALRSGSAPPPPAIAPAAAAPGTTAAPPAATTAPRAASTAATTIAASPVAPPRAAAVVPVAAPSVTTVGEPAEPPAIGPVVVPRRTRTTAPPATAAPPPATVAAPATTTTTADPPTPAGSTTTDPAPPVTTQPPVVTTRPPPVETTPTVSTDAPPGVF